MDYDNDMYDDDAYESEGYDDNDVDDDADDGVVVAVDDDKRSNRLNYTVLGDADIRQRQEDDINSICSVLSVSRDSAIVLLHRYQWSVSKVHEEWFGDDAKVRRTVGLLEKPVVEYSESEDVICGICFDSYDSDEMHAAVCGHRFCSSCWKGYVGASIGDGPGCLALRCPEPSCSAAVGQDMINRAASQGDREKYSNYLFRSYIENYRNTKWCPAPGCDYAVEFDDAAGGSGINYDVVCRCSYGFCWNCSEEAHRPVDCETVSKWIIKNSAESENTNWILANSKPCPKCKRPIEKNQGCMHMTCREPCKYEFCWLCLADWNNHGEGTGGFYACNNYEKAKKQGVYDESERRMQMAKESLEKYTHYFERWATNNSSRTKALADLQEMETVHLKTLSIKYCQPETQLIFILEAWQQIIECRRVLKWTYASGYYLPEDQLAKKGFFEYLQGEAEAGLERLHMCAEKELQGFLYSEEPTDGPLKEDSVTAFNDFRSKLVGLTTVTCTYFKNLVQALENGLSDVTNIRTSTSKTLVGGSSEGKEGGGLSDSSNGDDSD